MQPSCEAVDLSCSFSDFFFIIVRFTKDKDFLQTQTELFLYSLSATGASFEIAIMLEKNGDTAGFGYEFSNKTKGTLR